MTPTARIRHDIGKYVTLQLRFLPDDFSLEDLREALLADLAATRRGPAGTQSIGQVWEGLSEERALLVADPALPELGVLISELEASLPAIAAAPAVELARVAGLARAAAAACRALGRDPG